MTADQPESDDFENVEEQIIQAHRAASDVKGRVWVESAIVALNNPKRAAVGLLTEVVSD